MDALMNVKVKKLNWEDPYSAYGLGIHYALAEVKPGEFAFTSPFHNEGPFTIDDAHEFAQAHFYGMVNSVIIDD